MVVVVGEMLLLLIPCWSLNPHPLLRTRTHHIAVRGHNATTETYVSQNRIFVRWTKHKNRLKTIQFWENECQIKEDTTQNGFARRETTLREEQLSLPPSTFHGRQIWGKLGRGGGCRCNEADSCSERNLDVQGWSESWKLRPHVTRFYFSSTQDQRWAATFT